MKLFKRFLSAMLVCAVLVACAACGSKSSIEMNDYLSIGGKIVDDKYVTTGAYDKELFYRNIGTVTGADPFVLTDGDTYYLYATNANGIGDCSYLCAWKSTNLTDWESLGKVFWKSPNKMTPYVVRVLDEPRSMDTLYKKYGLGPVTKDVVTFAAEMRKIEEGTK